MKKILLVCLALALMLPVCALAEVLTLDLEAASLEELESARAAIDAKISDMQPAPEETEAAGTDGITFSGSGTAIESIPAFPFYPCRVVFTVVDEGKAEIGITGGTFDWSEKFEASGDNKTLITSYDSTNYGGQNLSLMVKAPGDWTIDIQPLTETGSTDFEGQGNAVSETFVMSGPAIATLEYDASANNSDYLVVTLATPSEFGYLRERAFSESLSGESLKGTEEIILNPSRVGEPCFYIIECKPETTWKLTAK